jgi:spermidine/putrescine transport system substrate-binding protein
LKKITFISIIFLIIMVFFFTVSPIVGCNKTTPKQLVVYVWEGYLPDVIADLFEQETGIKLNITFISDNDSMLTLLKGGGKADIVMPTQALLSKFYEANLAQPLDIDKIPNYEKVSEFFKDKYWARWDGNQMGSGEIYVIPYVFGTSGLVINTSKYTKSLDDIGWGALFDTDLKGRVSSKYNLPSLWLICFLYDIPDEDIINDTQGTLEKVREKAIALKNNVLKFYVTGAEIIDLMKNEEVWVSYIEDGNARKLSQFDDKFKYILPKEGGLGFTDTFMIPNEAMNPTYAYLFIDFMLRPDIAAMLIEQSGYNTTVDGALEMTEGIDIDLYSFTDGQLAKLRWFPNLPQEVRSTYVEFWEELSTIQ